MLLDNWLINICVVVGCGALAFYCFMLMMEFYCNWRYPGQLELVRSGEAIQNNNSTLALAEINSAIQKNPQLWQAYIVRAALLEDACHRSEADQDIAFYLEHNPENEFTLKHRASKLMDKYRFEEAIGILNEALKLAPDDDDAWMHKAACFIELKRHDEARECMKKLKPVMQEFMSAILETEEHIRMERYQSALECIERASSLQPANHGINVSRAQCYFLMEEYDRMRPELEHALAVDPEGPIVQKLWVTYLKETKQYDEALRLAKQLVERLPDDAEAWNVLGNVYIGLKNKQAMMDAHLAAHQRAPNDGVHMRNVGFCYSKQKHWSKAIEWTKRGLEKEPDSVSGLCNLAHYELCVGNVDEASRLITVILAKKPDYPNALEEQGWVYYVAGKYEQAEAVWQRAGEIKPSVHDNHEETRAEMDELIQQGVFARQHA